MYELSAKNDRLKSLGQRTERDDSSSRISRCLFQPVFLNGSVEDGIPVLINDKRAAHLFQDLGGSSHGLSVIVGETGVECLSGRDSLCQSPHGLLQGRLGIHPVMIEDIYIFQPHPLKALVQAGQQIFPAAPVSIRSRPHVITCFCADDQLVSVRSQIFFQYSPEILLRAAGRRPIIIRKIKMTDSVVKGSKTKFLHGFKVSGISKIVPESQ